jgi:hypothetical protein
VSAPSARPSARLPYTPCRAGFFEGHSIFFEEHVKKVYAREAVHMAVHMPRSGSRAGACHPPPRARRVAGRPLGDWLDLADVARLLRLWGDRGRA